LKIAICDDSSIDVCSLVSMMEGAHVHRIFSTAEELLSELEDANARFELYLLDIFMEGMNGIELGKRIRELDDGALICYVSSSPDYYAEAFSIYAFQYLIKPVTEEAFQELLRRASEQLARDRKQSVRLSSKGRTISIPYGRVLYIASMGHELSIHLKDGSVEKVRGRLDELADVLDGAVFARCHQSFLVNLYNVTALETNSFFCGTEEIPISKRYVAVKERYRALLFSDMD